MTQDTLQNKKSKKLFLIFHGRLPSNKAASLFAAKSAEAFAEEGVQVVLMVSRRLGREKGNPYEYYKVKNNFSIVYLPILDIHFPSFIESFRFVLSYVSFSLFCLLYLLRFAKNEDIIYSNEYLPLFFASAVFRNTFYEMHDFPENCRGIFGIFIRRMKWVLIHNNWKAKTAEEIFDINKNKIICEANAVQIEDFDIALSKEEARQKLSLPNDKKVVVYTGHLYSWKGVDTLAFAATKLPKNYLVVFVGGTPEDIRKLEDAHKRTTNILIVGWKQHSEVPIWQKAADVLVLPNTAKENISKYYTSPMKLFEYMASMRPIVATDIPSIREILGETNAIIVLPDDPDAMAEGIKKAIDDESLTKTIIEKAYRDVELRTWKKRAGRILDFIEKK
ncbi:MAG: glycosyltransferase family 4 protein [bacterium]|nr:glycosyltransferase family 4 protein [bacterium]